MNQGRARVGIVEDDKLLNEALKIALGKEGYEVVQAYGCTEGRMLVTQGIDLMILDMGLPDGDGIQICRYVREHHHLPIIFLTARDEETNMLEAFSAGADDYVVKPFQMKVLMKRVEAILRRVAADQEEYAYLGLRICYPEKKVYYEGRETVLTAKEYQLLEYMIRNRGQVLTKEMLLERIWDKDGMFVEENTLSVTINRLRKKIEPDRANPIFIRNVFGMGYTFGGEKQ